MGDWGKKQNRARAGFQSLAYREGPVRQGRRICWSYCNGPTDRSAPETTFERSARSAKCHRFATKHLGSLPVVDHLGTYRTFHSLDFVYEALASFFNLHSRRLLIEKLDANHQHSNLVTPGTSLLRSIPSPLNVRCYRMCDRRGIYCIHTTGRSTSSLNICAKLAISTSPSITMTDRRLIVSTPRTNGIFLPMFHPCV